MSSSTPLAYRMRPISLDDFVGQEHIVGEGKPLRASIEHDALSSVIFAGPPGTGKTTLAKIIARSTSAEFVQLNAVMSGVKDIKRVCEEAEKNQNEPSLVSAKDDTIKELGSHGPRTLLFIDEIHRFNKSQQDALLPFVESGTVILIGATTENPYFEVNKALVSRSAVYMFKPLDQDDIITLLRRALKHSSGYKGEIEMSDDAIAHLAGIAHGDARIALNALELSVVTIGSDITLAQAQDLFGKRSHRYDKKGEDHYDTISAFIKTMRGSDPDAALLWMYKMLESGEEARFNFRRMAIFASEDIGNADPRALQIVISSWQAFEFVGLPEGEYFLAHACIYLAQAPKSNAIKKAMMGAKRVIQDSSSLEVPNHLRNAPVKEMQEHGVSVGYNYPHDDERGVVSENYFPIGVHSRELYKPSERGFEVEVRKRMENVRAILRGA